MTVDTDFKFTEEVIKVSDLEVDRAIQRDHMDVRKIERFVKFFNPNALGVITVSRRDAVTQVVIDGMHRTEVVRRRTSNEGTVLAHVFTGLTRAEEAQMFLDLNAGNQPTLLDKFKARIVAADEVAVGMSGLIGAYGWKVAPGSLMAVGAAEKVYLRSLRAEAEPNYLQVALLAVTHAWGNTDTAAVSASILEAIGAMADEYGSLLDLDRLTRTLKNYPGGPHGLQGDGTQMANLRRCPVSIGIAEQIHSEYNKGRSKGALSAWRRKRA